MNRGQDSGFRIQEKQHRFIALGMARVAIFLFCFLIPESWPLKPAFADIKVDITHGVTEPIPVA